MKTLVFTATIAALLAFFLFYPDVIDPTEYNLPLPDYTGPLEENYKLSDAEHLYQGVLNGPESIIFHEGSMYTGLEDGRIVKVTDGKVTTMAQTGRFCNYPVEEILCGRPLGLRVGKDGLLYVIDAYYGIFTMNFTTTTGVLTRILPSHILVEGKKLNFPDDLDVDESGNIYFTDASEKWDLSRILFLMFENKPGGRVIRYNMRSGETKVLMKNLHFPNGIQISKDGKFLLVSEIMSRRILKYNLKGEKKGQTEVFADTLPAEPDNIRRSPRGYWVAFTSSRNSSNPLLLDHVNSYPTLKRIFARIHTAVSALMTIIADVLGKSTLKELAYKFARGDYYISIVPRHGLVIEFDETGKILRSFHSPDGKTSDLSEVKEHDGYLYLGSFINKYVGRLKL